MDWAREPPSGAFGAGGLVVSDSEDVVDNEDFYGASDDASHASDPAGSSQPERIASEAASVKRQNNATVGDSRMTSPSKSEAVSTPDQNRGEAHMTPAQGVDDAQKTHLDMLRAKIIAQRQARSRQSTPVKKADAVTLHQDAAPSAASALNGVDALVEAGHRAAQNKASVSSTALSNHQEHTRMEAADRSSVGEAREATPHPALPHRQVAHPCGTVVDSPSVSSTVANNTKLGNRNPPADRSMDHPPDLADWLTLTGYHDLSFREQKLSRFRERCQLEREALRIQERLEHLRQTELAAADLERSKPLYSFPNALTTPSVARTVPPSPEDGSVVSTSAPGSKRARSPDPRYLSRPLKRQDSSSLYSNGDATEAHVQNRDSPSGGLQEGEDDGSRSRDPSLERRQQWYRPNGTIPDSARSYESRDGVTWQERFTQTFATSNRVKSRNGRGGRHPRGGRK